MYLQIFEYLSGQDFVSSSEYKKEVKFCEFSTFPTLFSGNEENETDDMSLPPGSLNVIALHKRGLFVGGMDGVLRLLEIQRNRNVIVSWETITRGPYHFYVFQFGASSTRHREQNGQGWFDETYI